MFSTPHATGSSLHLGDLVVDMFNATKCGVIVGPGNQGVKVSWWSELDSNSQSGMTGLEEVREVDPLRLILLTKAVQC